MNAINGSPDLDRLVDAIMRIPGAADRRVRDRYVVELAVLLRDSPDFPRAENPREDISRLVRWCFAQPGGLATLVDAIDNVEEQGPVVERVRVVQGLGQPVQVLEPHERAWVEQLVAQIDQASLRAMVRDLANRWGPRNRPDLRDPHALLSLLEDSFATTGEHHPLFVFLRRLAHESHDRDREGLNDLASEVGQRTGVPPTALVDPAPPVQDGIQQYFVIRLDEHGLHASRYLLTMWLTGDDGDWQQRFSDDTPYTLEGVEAELERQLADLAADEVEIGDLMIEFILPRALLNHAIDLWQVSGPGHLNPIGVHFPVMVRDLARIRNRLVRPRWRRRCQWLAGADSTLAGGVRFHEPGPVTTDLYADLIRDPERPACVVVMGPSAAEVMDRMSAWLSAGIPVIVWCRDDSLAASFNAQMSSILLSTGVRSLRTAVHRLRQDARGPNQEYVGSHIALLWDEEARIPPDEGRRLRQPEPAR